MKTEYVYPVISFPELIDIFHATFFWHYEETRPERLFNCYCTFDPTFRILVTLRVLHERRPLVIRQNRHYGKMFLKRVLVVQQQDERSMNEILQTELQKPFAIRISQREMIENGNLPKVAELFSRTRVYLTRRGIVTAPVAERTATRFLSKEQYVSARRAEEECFKEFSLARKVAMLRAYRKRLDEENWCPRNCGVS